MLSEDAQIYPVIADPPVAGAVQETTSCAFTVDETVGADIVAGTVVAVMLFDAADAVPVPEAFVARTVNV